MSTQKCYRMTTMLVLPKHDLLHPLRPRITRLDEFELQSSGRARALPHEAVVAVLLSVLQPSLEFGVFVTTMQRLTVGNWTQRMRAHLQVFEVSQALVVLLIVSSTTLCYLLELHCMTPNHNTIVSVFELVVVCNNLLPSHACSLGHCHSVVHWIIVGAIERKWMDR